MLRSVSSVRNSHPFLSSAEKLEREVANVITFVDRPAQGGQRIDDVLCRVSITKTTGLDLNELPVISRRLPMSSMLRRRGESSEKLVNKPKRASEVHGYLTIVSLNVIFSTLGSWRDVTHVNNRFPTRKHIIILQIAQGFAKYCSRTLEISDLMYLFGRLLNLSKPASPTNTLTRASMIPRPHSSCSWSLLYHVMY